MHVGGVLSTGVGGFGNLQNCHVVTPFGEDIVVTNGANYPYLRLTTNTGDLTCGVEIGPIEASMLGDWEVYATFTSSLWGFMHSHQPLNLFLYGKYYSSDPSYFSVSHWHLVTVDCKVHVHFEYIS